MFHDPPLQFRDGFLLSIFSHPSNFPMPLLDKIERRYHRFGISGLLRVVAGLQAVVFLILLFKPPFVQQLWLIPDFVKNGEIWRLFTISLIPYTNSIIWIIFALMILVWIGDNLEREWGSFRLTLYYISSLFLLSVGAWFQPMPEFSVMVSMQASNILYLSLFMAFAMTFPFQTINIFGILPVQARWLGWLDGAALLYMAYTSPFLRLPIFLAMIPFLLLAVPVALRTIRQKGQVRVRRETFAANSLPPAEHFNRCEICGRTDTTNPELEFRVTEDGKEYCSEHLPK